MDINIEFDEGEFKSAFAEKAEELLQEYIESEVQEGHLECTCCSEVFDIETWYFSGELEGAAICRECEERIQIDVDTSELDKLK